MSQVAKLKKQAAEFEAKKQFDKAIGVYIKLLEGYDSYPAELDIGLFNRVGDLLIRQGNVADAVDWYERGIDKYSDTGFFNNAIALCNKVLRHSPGRASIYYKLGRISAKKGFTNEARTNFLEYADRMQKSGNVDEAFRALGEFADLCPDQDEIRLTLAEQLVRAGRKDDALEQLQVLHERLDGEGRDHDARAVVDRMRVIDPTVEPRKSQSHGNHKSSELIYIDVDEPTFSPSMPGGLPLVPPPQPAAPTLTSRRPSVPPPTPTRPAPAELSGFRKAPLDEPVASVERFAPPPEIASPVIGTPVIGTPPVAPSEGPSFTLSSAIDPDAYTVEEASSIFGGTIEGFTSTQLDGPAPGPLDGLGTARMIPQDQLPGGREEEVPSAEVQGEGPDADERPGDEIPEALRDEAPRDIRAEMDSDAEQAADAVAADFDPETELRASIEDDGAEYAATPADARRVVEAPPPQPLDGSMDELLGEVVTPVRPAPVRPSSGTSIPSPVLSPALSVPVEPPSVADTSLPEADLPTADGAAEKFPGELARPSRPVKVTESAIAPRTSATSDQQTVPSARKLEETRAPAPRNAPPEPIPGILLADALEASPRPEDSGDGQRAPIDEGIDEPIAFATPSQARRSTAVAAKSVETLNSAVQAAPDDWVLQRDLGEAMLDAGDREGGIRQLEYAMAGAEHAGKLDLASSISEEVARIEPEVVKHQQKRVEYAFRTNDRARLVEAYLGLANVLLRAEQVEKARTIYQRVLDLAPDEPRARLAIGSITPSTPRVATSGYTPMASPAVRGSGAIPVPRRSNGATLRPPSGSYVNLGDELRVDDVPRDTRMVVPEQEPTGDEQADFADMLRKFKAGIARNVAPEDHQSHYDLAIAYKEMGLVDEAIAEFQKALAGPTNRLPTYEALGQCFLEKEQFKLASSVLVRALNEHASEDQLVGILYLLGRAAELQGKADEALAYYQRVFVVDIQFRDIVDRMSEVEQTLR
jgi:tetratricopeptide (TPR) repeat protein